MCTTVIGSYGKEKRVGHNGHHAAKTMIDVPTITGGMFRSARQSVQFNFKSYQGLVTQILIKPLSSLAHPLRVQYPISNLLFGLSGRIVMGCVGGLVTKVTPRAMHSSYDNIITLKISRHKLLFFTHLP